MDKHAARAAIARDERAISLPFRIPTRKVFMELREAILEAISRNDMGLIEDVCQKKIRVLLDAMTEVAFLKGGRRAELSAEKVIAEPAREFAPVHLSLGDDGDVRARGVIDYLRRVSGIDPSKAQSQFEKQNAGAIGDLSDEICSEVKKAIRDLTHAGIHVRGGKAKVAQTLAANGVQVLNLTALAETLFRTQSQQAYAAGRWNAVQDDDIGPYIWGFEYITAHDDRVREGHRVLEGVRLPKDDPFWKKYFPPNGWNCRCTTLEIWKDSTRASVDFGITGRDPRTRTPDDMNVPPGFQGNVGMIVESNKRMITSSVGPEKSDILSSEIGKMPIRRRTTYDFGVGGRFQGIQVVIPEQNAQFNEPDVTYTKSLKIASKVLRWTKIDPTKPYEEERIRAEACTSSLFSAPGSSEGIPVCFDGLEPQVIDLYCSGFSKAIKQFPLFHKCVLRIRSSRCLLGFANYDTTDKTVRISFDSFKRLRDSCKQGYRQQPRQFSTASVEGVVFHELGHAIWDYVLGFRATHHEINAIEERLEKIARYQYDNIFDSERLVSQYATNNAHELVAETMAYYISRIASAEVRKKEPELPAAQEVMDHLWHALKIIGQKEEAQ